MARKVIGEEEWPRFLEQRSYDCSRNFQGVALPPQHPPDLPRRRLCHPAAGLLHRHHREAQSASRLQETGRRPPRLDPGQRRHRFRQVLDPGGADRGDQPDRDASHRDDREPDRIHLPPAPRLHPPARGRARHAELRAGAASTSLREDPDVLMVGEMRDPETMRLTLSASETGHLVMATVHSSTCAEALQRVVSAFPAEIQSSVAAQLADCMLARHLPAAALSARAEHPRARVRDSHPDARGEELHPQPRLLQDHLLAGDGRRARHVDACSGIAPGWTAALVGTFPSKAPKVRRLSRRTHAQIAQSCQPSSPRQELRRAKRGRRCSRPDIRRPRQPALKSNRWRPNSEKY